MFKYRFSLLALIMASTAVSAQPWEEKFFNPKKLDGDIVLPMPCEGSMVFRVIKTNTKKHAAKKNNKKLTPKLQGISLSKHYILLKKRNSLQLNFTTQPANLHGCKYIWTTTNPKVASVSSGKITAKSTGLAVVKLKIIHNQIVKTSTCTVRVTL